MPKPQIHLNPEGIMQYLQAQAPVVQKAGEQLAEEVRKELGDAAKDTPVVTRMTTNRAGRPVALVTIAHPSGLARQAQHGTLTRAAAATGLDVHRYPLKE